MSRPFAVIGLTVFLVLSVLYNASGKAAVGALIFFTAALVICLIAGPLRRGRVFPVAMASAAAACLLLVCVNEFYYYPQLQLSGVEHTASFTLVSEPEKEYGNYYYKAKTTLIDGEKVKVNVRLVFSSPPEAEPYDSISGTFKFYTLGSSSYSFLASHKAENRFLGAYLSGDSYSVSKAGKSLQTGKLFINIRQALKRNIMTLLPNDYGALCVALVTGDRSELSAKTSGNLNACGITHIVCVSGLHLSLWAAAILWVLKRLGAGRVLSAALTIQAVILLMATAGMTYSVVRAGIMMLIYLASVIVSRRKDSLNSLGIALLLVSVWNPYSPGSLSLRLSALSTLGIILYSEYFNPYVTAFFKSRKKLDILQKPAKLLFVTVAATGFCLPVSAGLYGSFNLSVFPSNILVVFAAEICMICAAAGCIIALISTSVLNIPALIAGLCAKYIVLITDKIASLKLLNIHLTQSDAYTILAGAFALAFLFVLMAYTGKKVMPGAAFAVAAMLIVTVIFYSASGYGATKIRAVNTGNGTAVVLSKKNETLLIGCSGDLFSGSYNIRKSVEESGGFLTALILPESSKTADDYSYEITAIYEPGTVYFPGNDIYPDAYGKAEVKPLPKTVETSCFSIESADSGKAFTVKNEDINLMIVNGLNSDYSLPAYSCDMLICRMDYPEGISLDSLQLAVFEADELRGYTLANELSSQGVESVYPGDKTGVLVTAKKGGIRHEFY